MSEPNSPGEDDDVGQGPGSPMSQAAEDQPLTHDSQDSPATARRKRKAKSERERRERLKVAKQLAAGVAAPPPATEANQQAQVVDATRRLLGAIASGDYVTYEELCDPELSCFEPEARGSLVEGLGFHKYYFDLHKDSAQLVPKQTMASHHVKMLGDSAAVIAYTRLQQTLDPSGRPITKTSEETRVWLNKGGKWRNVHFHRSLPTTD